MALRLERDLDVRVASNGTEALDAIGAATPDVALLDVQMPHMSGLEALRRIRSESPTTRIVMLSASDEDLVKGQAIEAGAIGYLSKATSVDEVAATIRRAHAGEALLDRDEAVRLMRVVHRRRRQEATERQRTNRLTPRQLEILQLMADGVASEEIAERLGLSRLTLRTHVQNILTRLAVHRKEDALVMAIRHGKVSATKISAGA